MTAKLPKLNGVAITHFTPLDPSAPLPEAFKWLRFLCNLAYSGG